MRNPLPLKFSGWILFFLCFLFYAGGAAAQGTKKEVRGTVSDSVGPMPGVSVTVKSQPSIGTTTDLNGKYILDVPDDNAVLVFSMVGYEKKEISVKGKTVIDVTIRPSSQTLSDVVVVAFGTQKKESVVSSITTINPSELKVPSSNLTTALAGKLAGVIAYQRSGEPGADNADFFIRGVTTFGSGKKDPLILIDGVEVSKTDLARLQADDVESFSILKDATATALYGSRAANGVVLVQTKSGKEGKAQINFRYENSISSATRNVELADPITYMELENEAYLTRNSLYQPYTQSKIENTRQGLNPYVFPAVDWQKELFKNSTLNQRFNMNLSGGGTIARYYVAGTVNQDNGLLKVPKVTNYNNNIDLKSYSLLSNVNVNVTKSTELIVRLKGNFDDYEGPLDGGEDIYRKVMRTSPVGFPAYYPSNTLPYKQHILFGNDPDPDKVLLNPYADMVRGYKNYSRSKMNAQVELKQDLSGIITEGLKFRALAQTNRESFFDVKRSYDPYWYSVPEGSYDKYTGEYILTEKNPETGTEWLDYSEGPKKVTSNFYLESAMDYNRTFGKHSYGGLLVFQLRNSIAGNSGSLQLSLPFRNVGLSGRATYGYDNRYFAEFNFGYNGSERFYLSDRYGFFPSAGGAWVISNEKFWDGGIKNIFTNLKLRGSYGLTGNDQIGNDDDRFFFMSEVDMDNSGRRAYFGIENQYWRNGVSISRYANADITWETAKMMNLALEVGLFDKWNIIAEYFTQHRENILMRRTSIPSTLGLQATPYSNIGEAKGKGIDISVDYSSYFGKDWWVQARGNFTYARSNYRTYEEPAYDEWYLMHPGQSVRQEWGYIAERLFVDEEDVRSSPRQFGTPGIDYGAGDIKYRDVNRDGVITNLDRVPIGYPTDPEIVYGFGFSTGYKAFDFSAFFQGSARSSFWIDAAATAPFTSYYYNNETLPGTPKNQLLKAYADNHWSEENRDLYALWPRLDYQYNANNAVQSTWFMRSGAFLRLKSVEVGYTLPQKLVQRAYMSKARVYVSGSNLATFTNFKLWDIEMGGRGLNYPVQRVINFGLQVGF